MRENEKEAGVGVGVTIGFREVRVKKMSREKGGMNFNNNPRRTTKKKVKLRFVDCALNFQQFANV